MQEYAYRLADTVGVNVPEHMLISLGAIRERLRDCPPWVIAALDAIDPNKGVMVIRDAYEMTTADLAQQDSSGIEELLVFYAWANAVDVTWPNGKAV